jgi:hypothetical protein
VKDSSTVGRPSSGSKKLSHCSNGLPMIQKNDSIGIVPNGHISDSAIINHVSDLHSYITESEAVLTVNGLGEGGGGKETMNSRGRSRERHSPRVHRGENSCLNFMIVGIVIFITGGCKIVPQDQLLLQTCGMV